MNESELWAVALGTGMLGLLLLTTAGAIAMVLSIRARRARDAAFAGKSQANTEVADASGNPQSRDDVPPTGKSRSRAKLPETKRAVGGGFWPWVKAWIFALVHAGTVSVVLGGITFFEDLAKAGEEIQRSGTVTFPKQLLPGTLAGAVRPAATRKRLSQPSNDAVTPYEDLDSPADPPPDTEGWEVVDLLEEADTDVTSRRPSISDPHSRV